VYQDIPEILPLLKRLKETLNLDFVLTTEVVEEIGGKKYPEQKEFLKEKILPMVKVMEIENEKVNEFRTNLGLYNLGIGEVSLLYYAHSKNKNQLLFIISSDKKDVLKKIQKIIESLKIENVKCIHGLFLYFLLQWLDFIDNKGYTDILFSSNRDFRISLTDLKEFEKEFEKIVREF